jgi:hypothetical protein
MIGHKVECSAVINAMEIVMKNNRMKFSNLVFHQICRVAMGMSSPPTIANLYIVIYKTMYILPLLNSFNNGLGIWLHDPDPDVEAVNWILFKTLINFMGPRWTSTKLSKRVIFMDMTIKISGCRLVTALHAKPMALYQYILPRSCHPPGTLTGLVFGQVLRIFQLCLRDEDINSESAAFHHCLLDRGYKATNIIPLLIKGIDNSNHYLSLTKAQQEEVKKARKGCAEERVFSTSLSPTKLILRCHPTSLVRPDSLSTLQRVSELVKNWSNCLVPVKKLTVAYHQNPNLANLLSYRNLIQRTGLKASSFLPGTT